jgi:hypothetical protein
MDVLHIVDPIVSEVIFGLVNVFFLVLGLVMIYGDNQLLRCRGLYFGL